jgi:hypothetical protein
MQMSDQDILFNEFSSFSDVSAIEVESDDLPGEEPIQLEPSEESNKEEMSAALSLVQEISSDSHETALTPLDDSAFPELRGKYKVLKKIGEGWFPDFNGYSFLTKGLSVGSSKFKTQTNPTMSML